MSAFILCLLQEYFKPRVSFLLWIRLPWNPPLLTARTHEIEPKESALWLPASCSKTRPQFSSLSTSVRALSPCPHAQVLCRHPVSLRMFLPIHLPGWVLLATSSWKPSPISTAHLISRLEYPESKRLTRFSSICFSMCTYIGQLCEGRKGFFLPFLIPSTEQGRAKDWMMFEGFYWLGEDLGCSDQKKIFTDFQRLHLPLLNMAGLLMIC